MSRTANCRVDYQNARHEVKQGEIRVDGVRSINMRVTDPEISDLAEGVARKGLCREQTASTRHHGKKNNDRANRASLWVE